MGMFMLMLMPVFMFMRMDMSMIMIMMRVSMFLLSRFHDGESWFRRSAATSVAHFSFRLIRDKVKHFIGDVFMLFADDFFTARQA